MKKTNSLLRPDHILLSARFFTEGEEEIDLLCSHWFGFFLYTERLMFCYYFLCLHFTVLHSEFFNPVGRLLRSLGNMLPYSYVEIKIKTIQSKQRHCEYSPFAIYGSFIIKEKSFCLITLFDSTKTLNCKNKVSNIQK